jgi:hypothetical protein
MDNDTINTALLAAREWLLDANDPVPRHLAVRDLYQTDFSERKDGEPVSLRITRNLLPGSSRI